MHLLFYEPWQCVHMLASHLCWPWTNWRASLAEGSGCCGHSSTLSWAISWQQSADNLSTWKPCHTPAHQMTKKHLTNKYTPPPVCLLITQPSSSLKTGTAELSMMLRGREFENTKQIHIKIWTQHTSAHIGQTICPEPRELISWSASNELQKAGLRHNLQTVL